VVIQLGPRCHFTVFLLDVGLDTMASSPREVGAAPRLPRDSGSSAEPIFFIFLRLKDFKHLSLLNARDPTTFTVW
jgi:hypothetical protein